MKLLDDLISEIKDSLDEGREKSIVLTRLEEAKLWLRQALIGPDFTLDAETVLLAGHEALARNAGIDIVYLHDADRPAFAALVRAGTPAYAAMSAAYPVEEISPHDHIEPGMF